MVLALPTEASVRRVGQNLDLVLVTGILGILIGIFVPLPTFVVDALLVGSIALSLLFLMTAVYLREPLEFSSFPAALLLITAYRLALNIATTRLILSNAGHAGTLAAGRVIHAFGEFVAGSDAVVGSILFTIIMIVQFVVITKGSNRIAEVAARFSLDALPGRQMAIDADLASGAIPDTEARDRRARLGRESEFYGAMDGAAKFVRGDAIAGMLVVAVNIVAGFLIGYVRYGMSPTQALGVFTRLTIGDGLVTQVPGVIVAVAAGLVVTRGATEGRLGRDLVAQVFASPRALAIVAVFLALLLLTPLPSLPLLVAGGLIGYIAWVLAGVRARDERREQAGRRAAPAATRAAAERLETLLRIEPLVLEYGHKLEALVVPERGAVLVERIAALRRQMATELGFILPAVVFKDNILLRPSDNYVLHLRGVPIARGEARAEHVLAVDHGQVTARLAGAATREPTLGLPAIWVPAAQRERAVAAGYIVADAATVVATHVASVLRRHAADLLTREAVADLLAAHRDSAKTVVDEVVPALLKPGELQKVLQSLLREGVCIRDLARTLETCGDYAARTKDPELLAEYVRAALSRSICQPLLAKDGKLHVVTIDPAVEALVKASIGPEEAGRRVALPLDQLARLESRLAAELARLSAIGRPQVLLCSAPVRRAFREIADRVGPGIVVLSFNEVAADVRVESAGMVAT